MPSQQLHEVAEQRDLLKHTFYQRWVAGELTLDELRDYACQYAVVVRALPGWLRGAAARDPEQAGALIDHALEEESHISLWEEFASSLGLSEEQVRTSTPNPATAKLIELGDTLTVRGLGAAVAWALEAQTPAVSAEKLLGLERFYGIDADSGGRYFELHQTLDVEHAAQLEEIIASEPAAASAAPAAAASFLSGLWDVLSSVEHSPASQLAG